MEHIELGSTMIRSVGYDEETGTLEVTFNGNGWTYQYEDVSPEIHQDLIRAESAGRFFNENIKGRYTSAKV